MWRSLSNKINKVRHLVKAQYAIKQADLIESYAKI